MISVAFTALIGTPMLIFGREAWSSVLTLLLLSGGLRCLVVAALVLPMGFGIAAVVSARAQHRRVRGLAILTLLSVGGAVAILYQPAATAFVVLNFPIETAVVPQEAARRDLDFMLSALHVRSGPARVLQAETYRRRDWDEHGYFYLLEMDGGQGGQEPQALKQELLANYRMTPYTQLDDDDSRLRSLPREPYPKWFDPKIYADADYLQLDSYEFVFCQKEHRVFFAYRSSH